MPTNEDYFKRQRTESTEQRRVRELREELSRVNATFSPAKPADVIYLEVETVASVLARRAAIEYMLAAVERRDREDEERRAVAQEGREEEARQVQTLRERVESDALLRAEVERRNSSDRLAQIWEMGRGRRKNFDALPDGTPDSVRRRLYGFAV